MGLKAKIAGLYHRANDSFGRHGIVWAVITFGLPFVSLGAIAAYFATTLEWFWRTWGPLGIFFVVLLTWILLGLGLLIVRSLFNPQLLRPKPQQLKSEVKPTPRYDWQMPVEAMIAFNPELNVQVWATHAQLEEATQAKQKALHKLPGVKEYAFQFALLDKGDKSSPEWRDYEEAESNRKALEQTFNGLVRKQRDSFAKALEKGAYVAQGFLQPMAQGAPPKDIPKEEWRLMTFDWRDNTLQKAKIHGGAEYRAIRIAKNPA